jgi:hypothetical protein
LPDMLGSKIIIEGSYALQGPFLAVVLALLIMEV